MKSEHNQIKVRVFRVVTVPQFLNVILKDQLGTMNMAYEVWGVCSNDNDHYEDVRDREGIKMLTVPFRRDVHIFWDLYCLIRLIYLFLKYNPKIVHCETPKAGLLGTMAARICRVPTIVFSLAGEPIGKRKLGGVKLKLVYYFEQFTFLFSDYIIPNNNRLLNDLRRTRFGSKSLLIGGGSTNGVDLKYFNSQYSQQSLQNVQLLKHKYKVKDGDFVIGFVGRLAKEKGVRELIDAFEGLSVKNAYLLMVGRLEEDYGILKKETISKIRNNKKIILTGRQREMREFYAMMDFIVLPSYREGMPNVLLEAASMGLPMIGTKIGGIEELVYEDVNGYLVDVGDADQLREKMEELIKLKWRWKEMGTYSRKIMEEKYSRDKIISAWLDFYKTISCGKY